MAGGENAKLIKDKAEYLRSHFLVWRDHQSVVGKGVYDFDLVPDPKVKIVDAAGKGLKVCVITPLAARSKAPGKRTNAIRAYYLPFQANRAFHHRLEDDVDFCFTPTLNGCTFVVGSGPTPLISHYNYIDDPTSPAPKIDQPKMDRHIARRHQTPVTTLKRADYKTGTAIDYKVTVVGIREDGAWHFYHQRRAEDMTFVPGKGSSLVTIALDQGVRLT